MGKGALPDFPVSWFTVTQGLAPWLDLYKLFWRFQQLKDGLEWNVFPLRWWVVKPDLGMGSEVKKWSKVAQSCPTLCNPMDCNPPSSSIHGVLQARILEWVAISFSRGSFRPRDRTQVSRIAGRRFGKDKANVKTALSFLFQPPAGLLEGAVWGGVSRCLYRISMVTSPVFLLSAIFFNTPIPPSSYLNVPSSLFFFSSTLMQEFPSWQI